VVRWCPRTASVVIDLKYCCRSVRNMVRNTFANGFDRPRLALLLHGHVPQSFTALWSVRRRENGQRVPAERVVDVGEGSFLRDLPTGSCDSCGSSPFHKLERGGGRRRRRRGVRSGHAWGHAWGVGTEMER